MAGNDYLAASSTHQQLWLPCKKHMRKLPSITYSNTWYAPATTTSRKSLATRVARGLRGCNLTYHNLPQPAREPSTTWLRWLAGDTSHHYITMCIATAFKSQTCPHKWLTITRPCCPGAGFDTCTYHTYTGRRSFCDGPKFVPAPAYSCPTCDRKYQYDGNKTRVVLNGLTLCDDLLVAWAEGMVAMSRLWRRTCGKKAGRVLCRDVKWLSSGMKKAE